MKVKIYFSKIFLIPKVDLYSDRSNTITATSILSSTFKEVDDGYDAKPSEANSA